MATQNRRGYGNPYGSADLGSGVRTTTGGSYRNPRLGIEDTTAFGRGFASTFRMPQPEEEEEKQKLKGIQLGTWADEGNDFHKDADGNTWDANLNASILANTNWTNGELAILQKAYENGDEKTKVRIQSHMNGYNMAIGSKGGFANYSNAVGDSQLHDPAASNRGLPDENEVLSNYNMADFNKWGNEDPNSIEVASKPNDHGIMQYGYTHKPTGTFINATAMTPEFIQKNIKLKYSQIDSLTEDYKSSNITKFKPMFHSSGTKLFQGTADEYQVKVDNKYVQEGTIYNFDKISRDAARDRFSTANDAFFDSALVNLEQKFQDGFALQGDLKARYDEAKRSGKMDNQLRLDLLKDHYTEQFKLNNGSDMYVLDPDTGRAVAKTYDNRRFFDPNYMKTERDISDDSFVAGFGSLDQFNKSLSDVLSLKDTTIMNTYGKIDPNEFSVEGGAGLSGEFWQQGFRSNVETLKPVLQAGLPKGYVAIYGEKNLMDQLKLSYGKDEGETNEDFEVRLQEKIKAIKTPSRPNADLFIIKEGNIDATHSYEMGVQNLDQLGPLVNIIGKYNPSASKAWKKGNSAFDSEQIINNAVDKAEPSFIKGKSYDKPSSAIVIGGMSLDDYAKKHNISEKQKMQITYRVLRKNAYDKESKTFLYE